MTFRADRFLKNRKPRPAFRPNVHPLEDRTTPTVTVTFATGVLTFTSDAAGDTVQIQSTATPDTVDYNAGGIGLTNVPGVSKVVYNGNAGNDILIVADGGGNIFAPVNGITFNAGGQAGDELDLVGGAATWAGAYNPTGPTAGSVVFTNTPGSLTQAVAFTGVPTVRNSMTSAGITVTTPATNDVINVAKGPTLGDIGAISAGPVVIDGGDRDDHGSFSGGANQAGWKFMEQCLNFVYSTSFNGGANAILAVGVTGPSQAKNAITSAAGALGLPVTYVTGAAISTVNLQDYRVLYVPTDTPETTGGIGQADLTLLNARVTDVRNFINGGGGVFAMSEHDLTSPLGWLQIPNPFTIVGSNNDTMIQTPALAAAGFNITNAELSNGTPVHNAFTGPAGFNNLQVFVNNATGQVITLGLGAQKSPGLGGGGPSTAVTFGVDPATAPTHPQMYVSATTKLTVDGAGGDDTVNVQHGGLTTTTITIADSGGTAGDVANLYGTTSPDNWDVNFTTAGRATLGGENVDYTSALETLNVQGMDEVGATGDTFKVYPDTATAINISGGQPVYPSTPGDTLQLSVVRIGNPAAGVQNPSISSPALPDGALTSTSHKTVTWTSIETLPIPLGLGGQFDFGTATSPVQSGWLKTTNTDTFLGGAYDQVAGWKTAVSAFDRRDLGQTPNSPQPNLYVDGAWGGDRAEGQGEFLVRVPNNQQLLVSLTIGDTYFLRDSIEIYLEGKLVGTVGTKTGEFNTFSTLTTVQDGILNVVIRDAGGHSYWTSTNLDVRPLGLVRPLTLSRTDLAAATTAQTADGQTTDSYFGVGADPGELLTLSTTLGSFDPAQDADPAATGVQALADATGKFSFTMLRPTGSGPATISALGSHGEASPDTTLSATAGGTFVQSYALPNTRKLDFGDGPGAAGYVIVGAGAGGGPHVRYTSPTVDALGFVGTAPQTFDRGTANALLRDGMWNVRSADGVFHLDLPAGDYSITTVIGDPSYETIGVTISGTGVGTLFSPPAGVANPVGQSTSATFKASTNGAGAVEFRISGGTGNWLLQSVEVRPYFAPLALSGPGSSPADGVTPVTVTGTGASPNALVTVTTAFGAVTSADKSPDFNGVQVLADAGGNFSFTFVPAASVTAQTASLTAAEVTGNKVYTGTQALTAVPPPPAAGNTQRYDFNGPANDTAGGGFTAIHGGDVYTTSKGFGWAAPVNEFERTAASVTALGVTATQAPLYRDGAWGYGSATFQSKVVPGTTGINVRAYVGDSYTAWGGIVVQAEGNAAPTAVTFAPGAQFAAVTLPAGSDANGDGIFTVTISNVYGSVFVVNGLDIAAAGALPPPLPLAAAAPGRGAGPALTAAQLQPVADAAIARWAAAGISADQLAALRSVKFDVADLSATGHLGEQAGNRVTLDATGGRAGWFVDSTPNDDREFATGRGPAGVDLLTVVSHELGHVLGRIDMTTPGDVMNESFGPAARRVPATAAWAEPADAAALGVYVG